MSLVIAKKTFEKCAQLNEGILNNNVINVPKLFFYVLFLIYVG